MNGTLSRPANPSEWMQFYQQTIDTCSRFPDANATTVSTSSSRNNLSPSSSFVAPKGCISKPVRRRSRSSRRTPTTVLNADVKNFRCLVQQFTGCRRRSSSTSISFGNARGPVSVNINFALGMEQDHLIGNKQSQQVQQQQQYQKEQVPNEGEEEECDQFSFDSITADDFLLTSSRFPSAKDDIEKLLKSIKVIAKGDHQGCLCVSKQCKGAVCIDNGG